MPSNICYDFLILCFRFKFHVRQRFPKAVLPSPLDREILLMAQEFPEQSYRSDGLNVMLSRLW